MGRVIVVEKPDQHFRIAFDSQKAACSRLIRDAAFDTDGGSIFFELFKHFGDRLDANPFPAELFKEFGIAESNSVMRSNVYKNSLRFFFEEALIDVLILSALAVERK